MKSRSALSAQWMSSNSRMTGSLSDIRSKNSRHAEKRFAWSPGPWSSEPRSWASLGSTNRRSVASGMSRPRSPGAWRRPTPSPRPRGCRRGRAPSRRAPRTRRRRRTPGSAHGATRRRRRSRRSTSRTPTRAGTCRSHRRRSPRRGSPTLVGGGVETLLDDPELGPSDDEGRLERRRRHHPSRRPTTRTARHSSTGSASFSSWDPVLVRDRGLARSLRGLADVDLARASGRLDPRGRVHEVAGDHALRLGAERDRRLPCGTPARARRSGAPASSPSVATAAVSSIAARTARSASSSIAVGAPIPPSPRRR